MILSDSGAFSQIINAPLGNREGKPRRSGMTMVIDKGLGYEYLNDLLEVSARYIDILKFGFGTSCVYPKHILGQKLSLCRVYSVHTMPGGTLTEIAIAQDVLEPFLEKCVRLGFSALEVSDGTIDLDRRVRAKAISSAKQYMALVVSEIGKKLDNTSDIRNYVDLVEADLAAGADYVVIEGRESGENVGIYGANGQIDEDILEQFFSAMPVEARGRVIWEAPKKRQQVELIARFGQSVNLGNIPPADVIALECLRQGLRADTFAQSINKDR